MVRLNLSQADFKNDLNTPTAEQIGRITA
jgi:hypothetical protein